MAAEDPAGRSRYLLDGRRVAVQDLIDGGLVHVGDGLRFSRPRMGSEHTAVVVEGGGSPSMTGRCSDVGLTLGNLPSALGGVVSVTPQSTLDQAVTLVLVHDFSRLPVLSGKREVRGAVTWKSIAQAWHVNPAAGLTDAMVAVSPTAYDTELVEVLPMLVTQEFVIVHDHTPGDLGDRDHRSPCYGGTGTEEARRDLQRMVSAGSRRGPAPAPPR